MLRSNTILLNDDHQNENIPLYERDQIKYYSKKINLGILSVFHQNFAFNIVDEANIPYENGICYLYNTFLTALITSLWLGNHSASNTGE